MAHVSSRINWLREKKIEKHWPNATRRFSVRNWFELITGDSGEKNHFAFISFIHHSFTTYSWPELGKKKIFSFPPNRSDDHLLLFCVRQMLPFCTSLQRCYQRGEKQMKFEIINMRLLCNRCLVWCLCVSHFNLVNGYTEYKILMIRIA